MRPFWNGAIGFGLVNIPVRLFPATKSHDVGFNLVHRTDASPIRYQVVCEAEDKPIERSETVRGLEVGPGQYVLFEPEELSAIQERAAPHYIEILDFVKLAEVDPVYFQKAYLAGPQPGSARAYALLRRAMDRTGMAAIARFGLRTKEHLAIVRTLGPAIAVETMFYGDEVADPADVPNLSDVEPAGREMELAETLINTLSKAWEPGRYKDRTRERMEELIAQKVQGQVITAPSPPPETRVEDLMAALERSLRGLEFDAAEPAEAEREAARAQSARPAKKASRRPRPG